jgi:hypothetical protein
MQKSRDWKQEIKVVPEEVDWTEERKQAEEKIRLAKDRDEVIAVRSWPESLADKKGFNFGQLTRGASKSIDAAIAASKCYGGFAGRLFMRGFFAAVGPAQRERGE